MAAKALARHRHNSKREGRGKAGEQSDSPPAPVCRPPRGLRGPKKAPAADRCIRVGGPGLPQARPETAGRSGRRFIPPIQHGSTTLAAGITALGGRRPAMSAGTRPRLRTPPAAARSPAHAFAEPLVCIWLCAFKCGRPPACWQLPGPPFRDVFCPVRAGVPGCRHVAGGAAKPASGVVRAAPRPARPVQVPAGTSAGMKKAADTYRRGRSPIPKTGAKDAGWMPPTRSQPVPVFPRSPYDQPGRLCDLIAAFTTCPGISRQRQRNGDDNAQSSRAMGLVQNRAAVCRPDIRR